MPTPPEDRSFAQRLQKGRGRKIKRAGGKGVVHSANLTPVRRSSGHDISNSSHSLPNGHLPSGPLELPQQKQQQQERPNSTHKSSCSLPTSIFSTTTTTTTTTKDGQL